MRKYGELPKNLGIVNIDCKEMMFYQYLPVKLPGQLNPIVEDRLEPFMKVGGMCCCDFIADFGLDKFTDSYVYLSVKNMFVSPDSNYNRPGWHSDGFLSDDINYIWCNKFPTVFNTSEFNLTKNHTTSMLEMEKQALPENDFTFLPNELVRLDQYNIHRVADATEKGMRLFVKVSISKDKYNLAGNSHNFELNYNWEMLDRSLERNHPSKEM